MFKVGDAIMHPIRGAGIIVDLIKRQWHGNDKMYYKVELLSHPDTNLMIPTGAAKDLGLRHVISKFTLKKVWRVLGSAPKELPSDHKKRYAALDDRMHTGDALQIAGVVRDIEGRHQEKGRLTTVGKRKYEAGINILAGEIAAVQGVDVSQAEVLIREKLMETVE
jgi:RNA polymerase-interacting CarD/CdnL/TRCF family regulator